MAGFLYGIQQKFGIGYRQMRQSCRATNRMQFDCAKFEHTLQQSLGTSGVNDAVKFKLKDILKENAFLQFNTRRSNLIRDRMIAAGQVIQNSKNIKNDKDKEKHYTPKQIKLHQNTAGKEKRKNQHREPNAPNQNGLLRYLLIQCAPSLA
jgi:hypothetical protein